MHGRKVRDAADARACLAQVAESGMDRASWARAHGVSARSLNAWRLILERQAKRPAPLHLVELVVAPAALEPCRYLVRQGVWEVEVDDRFDGDTLRRLLDVVAAAC